MVNWCLSQRNYAELVASTNTANGRWMEQVTSQIGASGLNNCKLMASQLRLRSALTRNVLSHAMETIKSPPLLDGCGCYSASLLHARILLQQYSAGQIDDDLE